VLTSEPPALTIATPLCPPLLDHLVRRCLAKDPDNRWQSMRDVQAELEWLAASEPTVSSRKQTTKTRKVAIAVTILAVITTVAAAARAWMVRGSRNQPPVMRLMTTAEASSLMACPVVSPDGSHVVYLSGDTRHTRLWVRSLSGFGDRRIDGYENPSEPFWSADSKQLAFVSQRKLHRIDIASGNRYVISDLPGNDADTFGGSWAASGTILLSHADSIYRIAASGGELAQVTRPVRSAGELGHITPHFLPDGRHFLFLAVNQRQEDTAIYYGYLDSPDVKRIMPNPVGPIYFVAGHLLFVRGGTLMAQPFDWKDGRLGGQAVSLLERPFSYATSFSPFALFSASESLLAYFPAGLEANELVWFDRQGRRLGSVGGVAHYTNPALAPDGKRVAVGITDPHTNQRDVWVFESSGGATRLTSHPKEDFNPLWSPDGKQLVFMSDRKGVRDLFIKEASPSAQEKELLATPRQKAAESWTPDGRFVLYNEGISVVMAVPVIGEHTPFRVTDGPGFCDQSAVSPDGKWVAYRSHDMGRVEVYLQAFPRGATRWQISTNGGGEPSWKRDSKELYFVRDKQLFAVAIKPVPGGVEHSAPTPLFSAPLSTEIRRNRYVPAPDGQRFLAVTRAAQPDQLIRLVLNWQNALRK